jgi:hypothetical protein
VYASGGESITGRANRATQPRTSCAASPDIELSASAKLSGALA